MKILIIRNRASQEQIREMLEGLETYMKLHALKGGASREGTFFYIVSLDPVLKDGACGARSGQAGS
jgi:hypothetical protein